MTPLLPLHNHRFLSSFVRNVFVTVVIVVRRHLVGTRFPFRSDQGSRFAVFDQEGLDAFDRKGEDEPVQQVVS